MNDIPDQSRPFVKIDKAKNESGTTFTYLNLCVKWWTALAAFIIALIGVISSVVAIVSYNLNPHIEKETVKIITRELTRFKVEDDAKHSSLEMQLKAHEAWGQSQYQNMSKQLDHIQSQVDWLVRKEGGK